MSPSALLHEVRREAGGLAVLGVDPDGDPAGWAAANRAGLRAAVTAHGALMVRGLDLVGAPMVGETMNALADGLLVEREAFAPRRSYPDGLYSATKWPSNQPMCSHHELSYATVFPGLMMFACLAAPAAGGATCVANATEVLGALPEDLVDRFRRHGWLLTRNYNDEIGASWADAFGTEDPAAVDAYCRANAIGREWLPDGGLRTRQRRSAVVRHPLTGARAWFNQIAFLNEWTLAPEVREFLVEEYGSDGLPFNTAFGDGEPIGEDVVALINETYEAHVVREPWQVGDLLLVDNIACAHSREAYTGPREVLVGMAEATDLTDCSPTVEVTAQ